VVIEHDRVDRIALARFGPRQPDEGDDRAVAARRLGQLGKLELRVERLRLEERNDAHPPDTGGRNSMLSVSPTVRSSVTKQSAMNARDRPSVAAAAAWLPAGVPRAAPRRPSGAPRALPR